MARPPVLQYGIPISVTIGMWKGLRKYLAPRLPYNMLEQPSEYEQWSDDYLVPEIPDLVKEIVPENIKNSSIGTWVQKVNDKFWEMDPRISIFILLLIILSPLLAKTSNEKVQEREGIDMNHKIRQLSIEKEEHVDHELYAERRESAQVVAVKDFGLSPNIIKDELANVPSLGHDEYCGLESDVRKTPSASSSSLDSKGSKINESSPHLPLQVSPAKTSNSDAQINNFQAYSQPFTY
uniref:Nuclear envelope protein n=1 Tax=Nakaseomyces delphensis TaxID=51657 RepID=A7WPF7_NAKDE|nr:nuclear envelope protein [Nakaseomyces delphensis]